MSMLDAFLTCGKLLNELIYEDVCVSINDLEKVLAYYPGKTFDLETQVGTPIGEKWLVARAMRENRKIVQEQDASVIGIPYIGIALPIHNEQRKVIGGIAVLHSIENSIRLQEMAKNVTDFVDNITNTMEEISAESEELAATSEELQAAGEKTMEHVHKTGEITSIINGISNKVKLIGLNASIEAARLGAEGAGFQVVANEIRNLAEQSASSVQMINEILREIESVVKTLRDGVEMISTSNNNQATDIESISREIDSLNQLSHQLEDYAQSLTTT